MILSGQLASENDVQRFRTEAEAAANLKHPNIVTIHEIGDYEGQQYFSMDFVEGQTLTELLQEGPVPFDQSAKLMRDAAGAIHFAHQRATLHRDIKPSNLMLDGEGRLQVMDFGLAKLTVAEGDTQPTVSGTIMGSPA